jgi:hypothetical protein
VPYEEEEEEEEYVYTMDVALGISVKMRLAKCGHYCPSRQQTATAAPKIADSIAISREMDFGSAPGRKGTSR